jgi:pimeloyl-ACP methyl ester carboxylesterase
MNRISKIFALGIASIVSVPVSSQALAAGTFTEQAVSVRTPPGTLSGTLMLPSGAGPFPVALIIAGSGPTDRDGNSKKTGIQTDAYKLLAQHLAANGIASLRYDKRFSGNSTFSQPEGDVRFDDFVKDASALVDFLKTDKRFSKLSVIGHSEGSLIGMILAQRNPNVGMYVSLEGAGQNAADLLDEQMRVGGAPQAMVDEVVSYNEQLKAGKLIASPDPQLMTLFRPSVQPYLISWFKYDPAAELAKLKIPSLVVQGTTDIQTSVADAKRLAAAVPAAQLEIIPGMNHILRDAPLDRGQNIATYTQPQLPLNAQLVPVIVKFIKAH